MERHALLDDRYSQVRRLDERAGSGRFSLLFTALDNSTGNRVALKFFDPDERSEYRRRSFFREEELLRDLGPQQGLVALAGPMSAIAEELEVGLASPFRVEFSYFALELAQCDVLSKVATEGWDCEATLLAARQIALALAALHRSGVAHRDLKPENLLVFNGGVVKVSDLGTARRLDVDALADRYAAPPGDKRYTAPEMFACLHDIDPRIALRGDMFSLGTILFELATGQVLGQHLLLDSGYMEGLAMVAAIDRKTRKQAYLKVLPELADRHLPTLADYPSVLARSVHPIMQGLISEMTDLDYRRRLAGLDSVVRRIDLSLLIVRNQRAYDRALAARRRRRIEARKKADRRANLREGQA